MDRTLIGIALTSTAAVCMAAAATAVIINLSNERDHEPPSTTPELPLTDTTTYDFINMPEFELVDQQGRLVTRDDVIGNGKWTVLDFMFTHCVLACPVMSGNMLRVNQAIDSPRVRFVSISVDPQSDTVPTLRAYAKRMDADDRWRFLSTDPGEPEDIVGALGLLIEDDPNPKNTITLPDGSTMNNIVHPTRFLVFNPNGKLVGSYRGMSETEINQLIRDLDRVLAARR